MQKNLVVFCMFMETSTILIRPAFVFMMIWLHTVFYLKLILNMDAGMRFLQSINGPRLKRKMLAS